ncbi:MAG: formylmethanofuran dehydrogenase, partial [Burkholderiaceae bacterium]|nr:formylmethanofuran dehydrogenase [Burkholderiaceae bacterium]
MSASVSTATSASGSGTAWTCPFCPLLCDGFQVASPPQQPTAPLTLQGSDCPRACRALQRFSATPSSAMPQIDGIACDIDSAIAAAARVLAASRQPLFGGLGTDVAGARALYRLACETGAISDAAQGDALMHGLRAMQDRG